MPTVGLDETTQADWSGGMCQAVARHLIPGDAAYDMTEALLDDDGNVYQRGPTTHATASQLGTTIRGLWEATFSAGRRMVAAASTSTGVVNAAGTGWDVIDPSAGSTLGGGLAAQLGEIMYFPAQLAGVGFVRMYAGSRITSGTSYTAGTVTMTNGSAVVTGAGTAWLANADPGTLLRPTGIIPALGVVKSVDTNTQVTLTEPWHGASGSFAYFMHAISQVSTTGTSVAVVSGRLLIADGRKVKMSNTIDQDTGASRPQIFDADDYHEFPADVVGMATLRDIVYVFTKAGIYSISNAALPIVDAFGNGQHRVQKISGDVVLRSPGGLAPWRDSVVVCAVGGIYTMDASGGLELISRSIGPLWQSLMTSGLQVYQAMTFRDHVFVPVGSAVYVGRLDRRTKTPVGSSAPWTRWVVGEPAATRALAVQDPYGTPKLVAGASSSGYLVDLTGLFGTGALPNAAGGSSDADGTVVKMQIVTREYVVDAGAVATVRDVALEYESTDGQLEVYGSVGARVTPSSAPDFTLLGSTAAGNYATQNPRVIGVRREARRVSFLITPKSGAGVTGWRLRAVRLRSRLRGRRR